MYPRHEMVYHTKAGTAPSRNSQIAFESVLGKKEEESSECGVIKAVSFIMKEF